MAPGAFEQWRSTTPVEVVKSLAKQQDRITETTVQNLAKGDFQQAAFTGLENPQTLAEMASEKAT
ncbi:MAG: hypothetical protein R3F14_00055 [Polyangiaceae bacterium]